MRRLLLAVLLLAATLARAEPGGARRVVALAPSLSEIMLELGAAERLVGVLDGGPRPPALAHLPSLGRYGQLDLETLLALQPDLILLWPDSVGPAMQARLGELGIPLIEAQPHSLDELAAQLAQIGARGGPGAPGPGVAAAVPGRRGPPAAHPPSLEALPARLAHTGAAVGLAAQGRRRAAELRAGSAALAARYARREPLTVFLQVWERPLYTLGGRQIVSDALRLCGARNVFADLDLPAPVVSVEAVLARDPAVILVSEPAQRAAWQRWAQLAAVRRGQVWALPDRGLERPSFQMLAATEQLCRLLAGAH